MFGVHITITSIAILAVVLILSLVGLLIYLHPGSKRATSVPGPSVIDQENGNINDIEIAGSLQQYLSQTHDKFGSLISFWFGKTLVISTSDIKHFAPRSQVLEIPEFLFENWKSCIGSESFLFSRGTDIFQRRNNLEFEISAKLKEKYAHIFKTMTSELVKKWSKQPEGDHIPLTRHMQTLSTKAISKLIFGDYFDNASHVLKLHKCWEKCWNVVVSKSKNEPTKSDKEIANDCNKLREVIEEAIEYRWNDKKEKLPVLIDGLIQASNKNLSHQQLISDSITLFTIGVQSTLAVLSWVMFFLIRNEKVQEKLRKKLTEPHSLDIMPESLVDHKYLSAVMKESVRCGNIFPCVGKQQDLDVMFDQKHLVHKQTPIIEAISVALNDPTTWTNPTKFDPDRFMNDADDVTMVNPLQFTPFAFAASRHAPQDSLIYLLTAISVGTIIREFHIQTPSTITCDMNYDNLLATMPCNEEIWITITQQQS